MTPATTAAVVYIVDDDDAERTALSRLMRSAGFEALAFASPDAFLEAVCQASSACILLDITKPGAASLQVPARLKAKGIDLPVIAVSARDDNETRAMARELGGKIFFRKPVDDRALLDAIEWVTGSGAARSAAGK